MTLADDVEWTEMAGFPLAGTYRPPHGATSAAMRRLGENWDDWIAHDDTCVVVVAHHFVVRGGRIVRFEPVSYTHLTLPTNREV